MYKKLIQLMITRGIVFDQGLNDAEFEKINSIYNLKMPRELQDFLRQGLPTSEGFYNWRDFSKENVQKIRAALDRPIKDIKEDIGEFDWCEKWGDEPCSEIEREKIVFERAHKASKLIPLYKHRYIASQFDFDNPVFSIYGLDIIYYGETLDKYLYVEFGDRQQKDIDYACIKRVEFWSDLTE